MNKPLFSACLILMTGVLAPAHAENYELSGKAHEMTWPAGSWSGDISFQNVYCATAPLPEQALRLTQSMLNRNTIYIAKIDYPENLRVAVALSTVPYGRLGEISAATTLATNRENQHLAQADGLVYEVAELKTHFGATVGLRINNLQTDTAESAPFPFTKKQFKAPNGALSSMSVHRIFTRGPDRFEVAAMQLAPQTVLPSTESEMQQRLTMMADEMSKSLQDCTSGLPARIPK